MLPNYQSVILILNVTNKKQILPKVKISYKLIFFYKKKYQYIFLISVFTINLLALYF